VTVLLLVSACPTFASFATLGTSYSSNEYGVRDAVYFGLATHLLSPTRDPISQMVCWLSAAVAGMQAALRQRLCAAFYICPYTQTTVNRVQDP
jgi:hypothetical protein